MALEYDDFTVRFTSLGGGRFRSQAEGPAGSGAETLEIGADRGDEALELESVPAWWRGQLRLLDADRVRPGSPDRPALAAVGERLHRLLFRGAVGLLFEHSLGQSAVRQRGLRLVLRFDPREPEVELLSQLPWELLRQQPPADGATDPRFHRAFLALNPETTIVRHLDNIPRALELEPLREILRVLVVIPDAKGIDAKKERAILEKSLAGLPVEVTYLEQANHENLAQTLAAERSHVLHYIGHGRFEDDTGKGSLCLPSADGQCEELSGTELATLARNTTSLRFVFLNACQTAKGGALGQPVAGKPESEPLAFSGVANALLLQGVPAVLAMQSPIRDDHAIRFTEAVYRGLTAGDALEEAVGAGRRALHASSEGGSFAIPVLFTRTRERILSLMSPAGLATAWTLLGLLATTLTFNVVCRHQGWRWSLPGFQFRDVSQAGVIPYGVILGVPVVALLLNVSRRYLRSRPTAGLADRLPIAFGVAPSSLGRARRAFQATFLILFLLFPLAAQVHFYREVCRLQLWWDPEPKLRYGPWDWNSWERLKQDKYVVISPDAPGAQESFYPFWEPLGFLLAELALFGYFGRVGRELLRRSSGP